MKRILLSAVLCVPTLAFAQEGGTIRATVDAYFNKSNAEVKAGSGPSADEGGDGFGIKGLAHINDSFMVTGEFQDVSYDGLGSNDTRTDIRVGAGYGGPSGTGIFAELVKLEDGDGFGVHGRVAGTMLDTVELYGQAGYVQVEDQERFGGFEFTVGGAYVITDLLGAFLDYRVTTLEGNESQVELRLRDLRVGVRMAFGGAKSMPEPSEDVEVQAVDDGSGGGEAPVDAAPAEEAPAEGAPAGEVPAGEEVPAEEPAEEPAE